MHAQSESISGRALAAGSSRSGQAASDLPLTILKSFLLIALLLVTGCEQQPVATKSATNDPLHASISNVVDTERTILDLSPWIGKIASSLTESGDVSKSQIREIFAANVNYTKDSQSSAKPSSDFLNDLWQPFLADRKFAECQFGTLQGTFSESKQRFEMRTKFEGKLQDGDGTLTGVTATQTITWSRINKLWTITDWQQHSFKPTESQQPIFRDATAELIPDPETRKRIADSSHQQKILTAIKNKTVMEPLTEGLPGFNDWEATWRYPSASVVDFDNDGWDDLFLTDIWNGGMLLRNVNGKFVDVTQRSGLPVGPHVNCAIFADFDNDGDQDAFIGRSILPSQYFVNESGTFRLSENGTAKFPRFVTAGSVADFNRDGLLDLYLSTYVAPSGSAPSDWISQMIPAGDRDRMQRTIQQNPFVDRGGPSNILLINNNGALQRCQIDDTLKQWRNSYQSSWHDWDSDGDLDLFVCNDFAPDAFLRNDTDQGSSTPQFVDVASQLISADVMGYSMGASWGDCDNDGDMDLFVSGMYSKAGKRILQKLPQADQRLVHSATGNFLFRNDQGRFSQVAGDDKAGGSIAAVGWSFGGQFADFNNNGWLDLYVPSGFYTAPQQCRAEVDL